MPDQTPAQSQGPMVMVKRADGSMARVLLSELKKMRAGAGAGVGISRWPAGQDRAGDQRIDEIRK